MGSGRPRVLLVEDEGILALSFKMALESCGFDVVKVVDRAEDAVTEAERYCPELISMDIRLKGKMTGVEAVRHICSRYSVSVIYVTGNTDVLTKEDAMSTKPFAYLEKPVDDKTLCDTMTKAHISRQ